MASSVVAGCASGAAVTAASSTSGNRAVPRASASRIRSKPGAIAPPTNTAAASGPARTQSTVVAVPALTMTSDSSGYLAQAAIMPCQRSVPS
jgi:hypothetical protein